MSNAQMPTADESATYFLAEFSGLRDEIVKRTEIQHQLISLALIAAGAFLTAQAGIAILAYPILALFLAAAWVHNDYQIARIGTYIRKRIEPRLADERGGWESVWAGKRDQNQTIGSLAHFASRGVFLGTQLAMFIASLLTYRLDSGAVRPFNAEFQHAGAFDWEVLGVLLLIVGDIIAIGFTAYLLRCHTLALDEREAWFDGSTSREEKVDGAPRGKMMESSLQESSGEPDPSSF